MVYRQDHVLTNPCDRSSARSRASAPTAVKVYTAVAMLRMQSDTGRSAVCPIRLVAVCPPRLIAARVSTGSWCIATPTRSSKLSTVMGGAAAAQPKRSAAQDEAPLPTRCARHQRAWQLQSSRRSEQAEQRALGPRLLAHWRDRDLIVGTGLIAAAYLGRSSRRGRQYDSAHSWAGRDSRHVQLGRCRPALPHPGGHRRGGWWPMGGVARRYSS